MDRQWIRKTERAVLEEKISNGVPFLSFPLLEQTGMVSHCFSTRMGGVSKGCYSTMNFTFTRGDDPGDVMENYRRMALALGVEPELMVVSNQTHTTNVKKVTAKDCGKGIFKERDYVGVDGLITDVPGITLVTFYADCVPLYFLDPIHQAIGLSHSGWKGTLNHMGRVTIERMAAEYGSKPEDLIACIGPSICQDCYEVGEEVADAFREAFDSCYQAELLRPQPKAGDPNREHPVPEAGAAKYQLNLWRANEVILEKAGILREHMSVTDICTHCNSDYLFSHRKMGNERGNLAAFLSLKK